jgi:hypothetical protein
MNIISLKPNLYETIAYTTLIVGVIGDHISTSIGLSKSGIQEMNPLALGLMNNGLWLQVDLVMVSLLMLLPIISTKIVKTPISRMTLIPMFIAGLIRVLATISNISLLI